eukprot:TRINITY_DN3899_c0_g1_i1.p1 TRINITY_DN3899_c0_g1~~TRINITY_DN3899_c0_g1_i1.p1  ORF type:complete len:230 (+),score=44.76 TRINITY_DN3899_c0_g1_i1:12-701(+)
MKFLENPELHRLNSLLSSVDLGDRIFTGKLEEYSCKLAAPDKKLAAELEAKYIAEVGKLPHSPAGPSAFESASRKTLLHFISTLNCSFPDYDFSGLTTEDFRKEVTNAVQSTINTTLTELASRVQVDSLISDFWGAIDRNVTLGESSVFSYQPDPETDPFAEDGCIWSMNYFIYNKNLKRIIFFHGRCINKLTTPKFGPLHTLRFNSHHSDPDEDDDDAPQFQIEEFEL